MAEATTVPSNPVDRSQRILIEDGYRDRSKPIAVRSAPASLVSLCSRMIETHCCVRYGDSPAFRFCAMKRLGITVPGDCSPVAISIHEVVELTAIAPTYRSVW